MTDERLRQLERRWKETGSLEDETAYLTEALRAGRSSSELFLERFSSTPDWTRYGRDDPELHRLARAHGDRLRTLFAEVPALARSAIEQVYEGDVSAIPAQELELTALCAHYVRILGTRASSERERGATMRRSVEKIPILTARLRSSYVHAESRQAQLIGVLNSMGKPHPTIGTWSYVDYVTFFSNKYRLQAHDQPRDTRFPRAYTFYTHETDAEHIVIGKREYAVLKIETTERPHE